MKNLLIVESPTKARVINRYLDNKFSVIATYGHLRDLPKKFLGLDLKNNFQPTFYFLPRRKKIIDYISKQAANSKVIYIATDPDREGEAIGWHITQTVTKFSGTYKRLLLNEITKDYLYSELGNPKEISIPRVNSQFARRIVDRLFGFLISPYVSKNLKMRGSAGRVQSPALRLIYERDREIKNFKSESFLELTAKFRISTLQDITEVDSKLKRYKDLEKLPYDKNLQKEIEGELKNSIFHVEKIEQSEITIIPPPPFNTSSLLVECFKRFKWSSSKTMKVAQILYEGVKLDDEYKSLITYIRTDSLRMNEKFIQNMRIFIENSDIKEYLNPVTRRYRAKDKFSQDAHEAIRPTDITITPESMRDKVTPDLYNLYNLIWKKTLATQLKPVITKKIQIDIVNNNKNLLFISKSDYLMYEGFKIMYQLENQKQCVNSNSLIGKFVNLLISVKQGDNVELKEYEFSKFETNPPLLYTEATLIKKLKKLGIGRPSTYAQIFYTLSKRKHIKKLRGYLNITEKGIKIVEFLLKNFPQVIDYHFTSNLEEELDRIEHNEKNHIEVIHSFYDNLRKFIILYKERNG